VTERPCCDPGDLCSGANGDTYRCAASGCVPQVCDYAGVLGLCAWYSGSTGTDTVCAPIGRYADYLSCAAPGESGCTSVSPGRTDAQCIELWPGSPVCLDVCWREQDGCDGGSHLCHPLVFQEGGVCIVQEADT
jgi:hypothetical protein